MRHILVFVGTFLACYLIGAFIIWELNPAHWTTTSREHLGIGGGFLSFMSTLFSGALGKSR